MFLQNPCNFLEWALKNQKMTTNTDYVLSVKIDNYCDYIPLVSTFKNIYNIYQKNVVIPSMTKPDLLESQTRSILRLNDIKYLLRTRNFLMELQTAYSSPQISLEK